MTDILEKTEIEQVKPEHLVLKNIRVGERRTSVRLEPLVWWALDQIVERRQITRAELMIKIDTYRKDDSMTSAIRTYVLAYFIGQTSMDIAAMIPCPATSALAQDH